MPEWLTIIARSFILVSVLFVITKWLGKKQMSELNIFEYISGIVLGGIVAIHSIDAQINFIYGLLAIFVWFLVPFTIEQISLKSKTFRDWTQGKSTIFIQDGKIMEDNLKKEGYSSDDLLEKLRANDVFLASDVEFAVLEPSGSLSILPKRENQPLTPKDIGLKTAPQKEPQTVVMDGKVLLEPLTNMSLNTNWLETELDKMNVSIENVFLAQADTDGQLTIDLYDDKLTVAEATEKPLLLASLKKCQADLELFALATENEETKEMYQRNSEKVQKAIDLITPYLG
ncbi:uncharacterized membrane protein YcaP (DUF421 family) [Virgibacillus halotolerans]|uniref:DUF421 domain-containing protein n=1 Tax=Virgibacillus halotolerans TaxID=1071053 RepID=UPI00196046DE|nr:DUF421 domain-containing protein [Virgibacillus halotolerans]MBM7598778.1 uncharacterized membrane protein YcaP (DUF421 family) [Virgibacillus halotolerans]